jgi:hypothetical protein
MRQSTGDVSIAIEDTGHSGVFAGNADKGIIGALGPNFILQLAGAAKLWYMRTLNALQQELQPWNRNPFAGNC